LNPQLSVGTILACQQRGLGAMMGFETLAVVLFVGWVLATSLFLRFG
jgi:hypothetical protein